MQHIYLCNKKLEMLTLILTTIVILVIIYYFIVEPFRYWKGRNVLQASLKWILINSWKTLLRKHVFADMVNTMYKQFPGTRYNGTYQYFRPVFLVKDPDLVKQITVKDFEYFTDHSPFIPEEADPLWSKNLFMLRGQKWRDMRAILSPSFTSSKMKSMFVLMADCAENFVQHFLQKDEDVITIEFKDTFTRFTNDVIATTAFGIKVDSLGDPQNQFYLMGKEATDFSSFWRSIKMFGYFLSPTLYSLLKLKFFPIHVTEYFENVVSETIRTREEKGIVRPDMINLLMEARKGVQKQEENDNSAVDTGFSTAEDIDMGKPKVSKEISNMEIVAQALIFFFAGFDGVSTLMCFMTYELTINPDIQARLREEIKTTLEEHKGKLTYEGLLKMKYLDMVVSETLRKWPNAVVSDRLCTKSYTIPPVKPDEQPIRIERGTTLWLPVFGFHRDPKYFPNPERFDPERFSDENKDNIKAYTYFPFGMGPRNCIGSRFALLETKVVMFYILKHFQLIPVARSIIPLRLSKSQVNFTAEGGFWFGLKHIKE